MARPTKFTKALGTRIVTHLRAGATRKAAVESCRISYQTFLNWLEKGAECAASEDDIAEEDQELLEFFESVREAEALLEVELTNIIITAARGYDTKTVDQTTKTVIEVQRERRRDGTVIETPVALKNVTTKVHLAHEFSPQMALEVLKRRRNKDWGDKKQVDVRTLTDEQLLGIIAEQGDEDCEEGSETTGAADF